MNKQKPVAWLQETNESMFVIKHQDGITGVDDYIPLYTHPAPSWQGLSDDEILPLAEKYLYDKKYNDVTIFAHAIEQALKEKNG